MANRSKNVNVNQLTSFLRNLGLIEDEVKLYKTLIENGTQTKLQIARRTGINRTNIYRLTEGLKQKGFVQEIIEEHTTLIIPTGVDVIQRMVAEQEENVIKLKEQLQIITPMLSGIQSLSDKQTKVLFYRGQEGIRQMAWNVLKMKTEGVGFTYRPYAEIIGREFLNKWREEFMYRNLVWRDIYSDEYLKNLDTYEEEELGKNNPNFPSRYITNEVLTIDHQLDIYNDVVAIYNWYEGEVFGVEIYNEKVAKLQKQLFEIVWKIAEPKKGDLVLQKS